MIIRKIASTALNFATGGAWGTAKWIGRRFKGDGNRQTFFGRVAVFLVGHMVFSAMTGAISPWGLLKAGLRGVLYLSLAIIHMAGGEGRLPPEEGVRAKGAIVKFKEGAADRFEKLKEAMERKAEDERRKHESEIAELKRAADAKAIQESIAKIQKQAEEEAKLKRLELACQRAQISAKLKAEKRAATRAAGAAKFAAQNYGIWGPSAAAKYEEHFRAIGEEAQYSSILSDALSRVGVYTGYHPELCWAYRKNNPEFGEKQFLERIGPVEDWNAYARSLPGQNRNFYSIKGDVLTTDPGFIEPYQEAKP